MVTVDYITLTVQALFMYDHLFFTLDPIKFRCKYVCPAFDNLNPYTKSEHW